MSPRTARLGVDIFAALVVASIGVALAGLTWRLLGDPGRAMPMAPVPVKPRQAFDLAALVAIAPFGSGAMAAAQATDQSVILRGIMLAEPRSASSALISVNGAAPAPFYIGQSVGPGTISAIDIDHVTFTGGGGRQILAFADRSGGAGGAPAAGLAATAAPPPPSSAMASATPAPVIPVAPPPSMPAPVSANGAGLLSSIGAPAADGLHVGQPNPQMRAAGLRPGDVVTAINNTNAQDAVRDPAAITRSLSSGSLQLQVTRGGQPLTLTVPLR